MGANFGTRQRMRRGGKGSMWKGVGVAAGVVATGWLGIGWLRGGPTTPVALATPPAIGVAAPGDGAGAGGSSPCEGENAGAGPQSAKAVPPELLAAFDRARGEDPLAFLDLRRLVKEHPGTPEAGRAQGTLDQERARAADQARALEAQGEDLEGALRAATRAYLATVDRAARRALRPALLELSAKVHFGPTPPSGVTTYTIAKGDVLTRVADAHHTDYRLIQRLSRLQNDRVRIGQRLRVPQAPVTVVVFKKDFELIVLFNGNALKVYDIATGKDGRTPEGSFRIGTKMEKPDWYSPEGRVYRYGAKENILGTRWLAFENTDEHQGFGIHGTTLPESIGTESSMGCVRMRNEEVEELYDLVPRGTEVRIVR